MYDRRLEAIVAAAEQGSFSKAAAKLHLSTPSLAKQIETFEAEHGIALFERSHHGVSLTPAGASLVEDARAVMRLSSDSLRRARECSSGTDGVVRLGVSMLCPARKTLDAWPHIHGIDPSLKMELVPVGDLYDDHLGIVRNLGADVDIVQTTYSSKRWGGLCQAMPMGNAALAVDVPRVSPLSQKSSLTIDDLAGQRVHILRHASDVMDDLRGRLAADPRISVIDVSTYTLSLYNECAESGGTIITSGAWSGQHPALTTVPLAEEIVGPCVLLYPNEPSKAVQRFVDAFMRLLEQDAQ